MSYYEVNLLANDQEFMARIVACAATENIPDAFQWGTDQRYAVAGAPGFGAAYSSALLNNVPNPGRDEAVISDPQILARVNELKGA